MSGHNPVVWPKEHTGAAAAAASEDKSPTDSEEEAPKAAKAPAKRGVIIAGARQGRPSAEAVNRTETPVTVADNDTSTPKGLAKGVSIALGITKERASFKKEATDLRRQLKAAKTNANTLLADKNKEIATLHKDLAASRREYQSLKTRLASEGQRAFDLGYNQAKTLQSLRPSNPIPTAPAPPGLIPVGINPAYAPSAPVVPATTPTASEQVLVTALKAFETLTGLLNPRANRYNSYRGARGGKKQKARKAQATATKSKDSTEPMQE